MTIVFYEEECWKDDQGNCVGIHAGDFVDHTQCQRGWHEAIPTELKLETLPIKIGNMTYRVSAKKQHESTYVHLKGFKSSGHTIKKSKKR